MHKFSIKATRQALRAAVWMTATLMLLFFLTGGGQMPMMELLLWPYYFLGRYAPPFGLAFNPPWLATLAFIAGLFLNWYVSSFLLAFAWITTSGHFKWAIGGCILVAFATWAALDRYASRDDWTSRGLNPARPGFQPQVVLLAGTFDSSSTSGMGGPSRGSGYFEIRMLGADYYYCKRWQGREWKPGSWFNVQVGLPGACGSAGRSKSRGGVRGGGGGDDCERLIARRLWRTNTFVGVLDVRLSQDRYGRSEEFLDPFVVGPFQMPRTIKYSESGRTETLKVRRVEFWNSPDTNWFALVRAKYLDSTPALRGVSLDEPGVDPEKR